MLENSSRHRKKWRIILLPAWVLAGFLIAQLIITGLAWVLIAAGLDRTLFEQAPVQALFMASVYALAILIVISLPLMLRKRRTTLKELGLQELPTWTDIILAPAGLVVYLALSIALVFVASSVIPWFDIIQAQDVGFNNLIWRYEYILAFVALVVLVPIAEEVLFRGYLYGKMRKVAPIWLSVILTSVLFGAVHGAWNLAVDMFALGVVLSLLREMTGRLWAPILLHMLKNAIAFYLLFINPAVSATLGT